MPRAARPKKLTAAAAVLGALPVAAFTGTSAQAAVAGGPPRAAHEQAKTPASAERHPIPADEWAKLRRDGLHPNAASYITWDNREYNKYLGIVREATSNGNWANVHSWFDGPNQKWIPVNLGYSEDGFTVWAFVNYNSGLCLANHYNEKSGGHVDQWSCGFDSYPQNERWIEQSSGNYWYLRNLGAASLPPACGSNGGYVTWNHDYGDSCLWH